MAKKTPKYVKLDADVAGHYLVVLADYHGFVTRLVVEGHMPAQEGTYLCYLIGNIEGRLIGGKTTEEDCDLIAGFEAELEEDN